jgi:hypothetical protein
MTPGATEMRDLPGGRRFTPVSSAISHVASPQMAQPNSHLHSPHLSSYPPAYVSHSYAPALASPSANFSQNHEFTNAIFLEDENRQLKSKLAALNEKNRKVEFLQNSLDRVQVKKKGDNKSADVFDARRCSKELIAKKRQVRAKERIL